LNGQGPLPEESGQQGSSFSSERRFRHPEEDMRNSNRFVNLFIPVLKAEKEKDGVVRVAYASGSFGHFSDRKSLASTC
jgi:hypothetical protein